MDKITLNMEFMSAMVMMSEGNPGAATALAGGMRRCTKNRPDSMWETWGPLLALDGMGIYGSRVWILYKDICERKPARLITLLRAVQLGLYSRIDLMGEVGNDRANVIEIQWDRLLAGVKKVCKQFDETGGGKYEF